MLPGDWILIGIVAFVTAAVIVQHLRLKQKAEPEQDWEDEEEQE